MHPSCLHSLACYLNTQKDDASLRKYQLLFNSTVHGNSAKNHESKADSFAAHTSSPINASSLDHTHRYIEPQYHQQYTNIYKVQSAAYYSSGERYTPFGIAPNQAISQTGNKQRHCS